MGNLTKHRCKYLLVVEKGKVEYRCTNCNCISRLHVPYLKYDGSTGAPLCQYIKDVQDCPYYSPERSVEYL